jgi:hypothetical protein
MMSAMLKQLLLVAFAHYAFGSVRVAGLDMTQSEAEPWVNMDLYLANMSSLSRDESWAATMQAYTTSDPATGFSISSLAPVPDLSQPYASLTKAYWSSGGYTTRSDEFVRAAIDGTGEASGWDAESRRELLTKGAAYEVVRQNIFYRLRSAVDLCSAGQTASSALALQWEIGYALHAGSLEGTDGSGSGKSTYALADKRCPQFGTCVGDSLVATSNVKALAAWQAGISLLLAGDCVGALHEYDTIVAQLTVPLVQGMLREAYEVDPDGGACCAHGVVEVAEGWPRSSHSSRRVMPPSPPRHGRTWPSRSHRPAQLTWAMASEPSKLESRASTRASASRARTSAGCSPRMASQSRAWSRASIPPLPHPLALASSLRSSSSQSFSRSVLPFISTTSFVAAAWWPATSPTRVFRQRRRWPKLRSTRRQRRRAHRVLRLSESRA